MAATTGGTGRRIGLGVGIAIVIAIIILFSFGLDLWTDALWYASVGFDGVFWTRLGAQVGLFAGWASSSPSSSCSGTSGSRRA